MCPFSDKCGACRRKVSQGMSCSDCRLWFHYDCTGSNISDSVINDDVNWKCRLCVQLDIVRRHEETILNLRKELELAKAEITSLKSARNLECRSKSPEYKVVSNKMRKYRSVGSSSHSNELELSNRFSVLDTPEQEPIVPSRPLQKPVMKKKKKVLVLGSSHGRDIGPRLQASLGNEYAVTSVFKPNACLSDVVGDISALSKGLDKEDHVVVVGGAGNSLDRNLNYSIEADINYIAGRSGHTNVSFVNLFRRHDRPWIDRVVGRVNLQLDLSLLGGDRAHIDVIDTTSIVREEYTRHGLHLNSRGKGTLTRLIVENIRRPNLCHKIPVVNGVRATAFLD